MNTPPSSAVSWGKSTASGDLYPLVAHHLDTALVLRTLVRRWLRPGLWDLLVESVGAGDPGLAESALMVMAASHDVGKANPVFQTQALVRARPEWATAHETALMKAGLPAPHPNVVSACRAGVEGGLSNPARRHEYVGYWILAEEHPDSVRVAQEWLAVVVGGHHGRWSPASPAADTVVQGWLSGGWGHEQSAQRTLVQQALGAASHTGVAGKPGVAVVLASGLLILADWLASDDGFVESGVSLIRSGVSPVMDPVGWMAAREEAAAAHTLSLVSGVVPIPDAAQTMLQGHAPRPLQSEATAVGDAGGLWTVMYPTGEGKTEAALLRHVARDGEGIIFALPTRATTDAMDARLAALFEPSGNQVFVSHAFAAARDVAKTAERASSGCCDDLNQTPWFTSSIRRLVAPVVAATCDQVLAGALTQWHVTLRLLALANHHIVFDEVHTFDPYQQQLLMELLAWFGATNTRVTLLSATLPQSTVTMLRDAYAAGQARDPKVTADAYAVQYPGHNLFDPAVDVDVCGPVRPGPTLAGTTPPVMVDLDWVADPVDGLFRWAGAKAQSHPTSPIAVVANTVRIAAQTAEILSVQAGGSHEVVCLHSQMTYRHRRHVEEVLRSRLGRSPEPGQPLLVVGTQVIEASLDLDFDLMASMLAPAASLMQRAGRLWRFGASTERAQRVGPDRRLHVVATGEAPVVHEKRALPYFASELQRVARYLSAHPTIRVPEGVQEFVETARAATVEEWEEAGAEFGAEQVRVRTATLMKADLLALVSHGQRLKWAHLVALTKLHEPEERMGTRFVDRPSNTYLLFDSQRRSPWTGGVFDPSLVHAPTSAAIGLLDISIPVGPHLDRALQGLHQQTLARAGLSSWEPRAAMLRGLVPVDLALADREFEYDPLIGLTRKETT